MNKFDKYCVQYADTHSAEQTIHMLKMHNDYLHFLKYDSSVAMITTYENKIIHNNMMIVFLKRFGNLRGYFK